MSKIMLTEDDLEELKLRREKLIQKKTEIAEEIKRARGFGDLSENAEYAAAREAQSQNEEDIAKLDADLENYELIDTSSVDSKVATLNSFVEFKIVGEKNKRKVKLVSKINVDPLNDYISNESPIGKALLNHKKGDIVDVITPAGTKQIKIMKVTH